MDQQLKQRLVGISVIFALAVIFLPMILDGSGQHLEKLDVNIPVPPRVESRVDVRQQVIELKREVDALPAMTSVIVDEVSDAQVEPQAEVKPETTDTTVQKPEVTKPPASKPTTKATASNTPEIAKKVTPEPTKAPPKVLAGGDQWVIQVGSFQDKDKAYKQRDLLRKSRLSAVFIEKFTQDGSLRYRVRMGPFLTRDKAKVVKNKVLAKYSIKGWLMKYEK
jgi:DedD protein